MKACLSPRVGASADTGSICSRASPYSCITSSTWSAFRWEGSDALVSPASIPSCSISSPTVPGFGKGGTGVLKVDGTEVANEKIPHTIPALMPWDETFDVGIDTRTGVEDNDYQVPFPFNGSIGKLEVALQP